MYVAVKGGEAAIRNAHRLLARKRRGDTGVEAGLRRQPGQPGICHRFRNGKSGQRDPGQDIGPQPLAIVVWEPFSDWKELLNF